MARYDLGLSFDEFEECTPAMFRALCKRRHVRIKYERYAHALTASAVWNTSRVSDDQPIIKPFDYVMDDEQSRAKENRDAVKRFYKGVCGRVPHDTTRTKLLEVRRKAIADVVASGVCDKDRAEALFNEVWASLKPNEGEE